MSHLECFSVKIKTITPTFSGRSSNDAGLLPQSIRGVMRFWFRACLPMVYDFKDNYTKLNEIEELIFGSTNMKSPFDILVDYDKSTLKCGLTSSMEKYKYVFCRETQRSYIEENTDIEITFIIKKKIFKDIDKLLFYILELTSHFGGFGMRSRKGFGSFEISSSDLPKVFFGKTHIFIIENIKNYLIELIKVKYDCFISEPYSLKGIAPYPMFLKDNYFTEDNGSFSTIHCLFYELYSADGKYKRLRKNLRGKGKNSDSVSLAIKHLKTNNLKEKILFKQSILGLPVIYKIASEKKARFKELYELNTQDRKGSTLFISVHKDSSSQKFFYRILFINSNLGNNLTFSKKNKNQSDQKISYSSKNTFKIQGIPFNDQDELKKELEKSQLLKKSTEVNKLVDQSG